MKKPFTLKPGLLVLLLAFAASAGRAQTIIAQQQNYSAGSLGFSNYYDPEMDYTSYQGVGQTFKSLVTGTMGTIQVYVMGLGAGGNMDVEIYSCSSGTSWGSLLNTQTNVPVSASGWVTVDVTALNILLTAGNYYGFRLMPQNGLSANIGVNSNLYADGQSWSIHSGGSVSGLGGLDVGFSAAVATTLPVILNSFAAQKQNNTVLLQWSTASEQNSKDFTVQHSIDGNSWSNLSALPAAGNSNSARNYSYVHTSPATGNNYYRLLQTDIDGKSNYTEVRMVSFSANEPGFTVMANPVINGVLRLHVNNTTGVSLYSADGRLLWKKQLNAGVQTVDMSRCGKGVFLLKGDGAAQKLVVQ